MLIVLLIIIVILLFIILPLAENNKSKDLEIKEISDDIYEKIEEENKKIKIRNYVEAMTLFELQQMLPDDIFKELPKKRKSMEDEVIKLILEGKIDFKNNNSSYYVDSDRIAENNKDYYNKNFKEKKDDIKHFESIRKDNGISVNMDLSKILYTDKVISGNSKETSENIKDSNMVSNNILLEDKIKYALTLEANKKNLNTFKALLNEYNNLDFDTKFKINRKYVSQLETLKNKAERS